MPFGLKNAPANFQRAMDVIFASVKWKFAHIYLDDVVVFSNSPKEHIAQVHSVLNLLRSACQTLKLRKCFFFHDMID